MPDQIVPGVWWLRGTRGSNVYLVEAQDGQLLLVDSGFATSAAGIVADLAAVARGRPVSQILLTHAHVDHAGAAMQLREQLGAQVVAGAGDCTSDGRDGWVLHEATGRSHRARRVIQKLLGPVAPPPLVIVDRPLAGQVTVAPGILAVPTPGHTPGSYCYVDEERGVAFVGDLVISHSDALTRPMAVANADDTLYLASLHSFAERAPQVGCAGHGRPVTEGFGAQLRQLATMPRRSLLSPFGMLQRARRLRKFASEIARQRR